MFDTAGFSKNNKEHVHELAINQTLKKYDYAMFC